jgi:hypothetical protein
MSQTNFQPDAETQRLFQEALQKNKKEREEKEQKRQSGFSFNYEKIEWCGLKSGKDVVGRLIGRPIELRKEAIDPSLVYFSKILNDNGTGYIEVKWKQKEDGSLDNDWILKELYDAVMKKEWVKYADGHKNDKNYDGEYHFVNKDKPSFLRLSINKKKDASAKFIPPKSSPKKRLLINFLDRMDSWCKDNKHYKLLSSNRNYWKDDDQGNPIVISDFGVPEMVYTRIIAYRSSWDLDVIITKNYNPNDLANAYIVKDIFEDKISIAAKEIGKTGPLTEEEKSYAAYDIDKFSKPTSYQKLLKNLMGLFTYADADTGMRHDFVNRLKKLAEDEAKENAANKKEQEESKEVPIEINVIVKNPIENAKAKSRARQTTIIEVATDSIESLCAINFPKWDVLSSAEKKEYLNWIEKFDGKVPVYKSDSDPNNAPLPCPNKDCRFVDSEVTTTFPVTIFTCAVCGVKDPGGNS